MKQVLDYLEQNSVKFLNEVIEFLKIPSISSSTAHKQDVRNAASFVIESLKQAGITDSKLIETEGNPIVFGQWMGAGNDVPTILIYGHYDVQPVDPLELWTTPPFEPSIRDGKIWARGTADDKCQVFTHIKAVEAFMKTNGKLPVNVKFIIEGEEEAGSSHLDEFIINNADLLACDSAIVSDTEWITADIPSLCYGLRGIAAFEATVRGPNRDLHSGTYGGGVDNPVGVLCWMMSQLKDRYGRILIPGLYDDVLDLTDEEREGYLRLPNSDKEICREYDIRQLYGETGYTTLERQWARPALDINGFFGGYTEEGFKTILPTSATVKFSIRLVPNQKPEDISEKVVKHLESLAPPTVNFKIKKMHGGDPVLVPRDNPAVRAAMKAMELAFGKEPSFTREGGSIPIVGLFESVLHVPTVLMGFGLPMDNIHSPDENFDLEHFYGGIKDFSIFPELFWEETVIS